MENDNRPNDERLHNHLRDYYGTAMFNGNPMAMMELEESERASGEELRRMAQSNGIYPESQHQIPAGKPRFGIHPYHAEEQRPSAGIGISVTARTQTIGPAVTRFFDSSPIQYDTGFFAEYGQALRRKVHEGDTMPTNPTEE